MEDAIKIDKYRQKLFLKEHSHGFQKPYTPYQIATWVVFGFNVIVEYAFIIPLMKVINDQTNADHLIEVFVTIFLALNVAIVIMAYLTTMIDPSDPIVKQERYSRITNQNNF